MHKKRPIFGLAYARLEGWGRPPCFETHRSAAGSWKLMCSIALRCPQHEGRERARYLTESSIPRQLPQLRPSLGRAFDHGLPGHVVGLGEERLRRIGPEVERLDAGGSLPLALGLDHRDLLGIEALEPQRRVIAHLALRVVEPLPGV